MKNEHLQKLKKVLAEKRKRKVTLTVKKEVNKLVSHLKIKGIGIIVRHSLFVV